MNYRKLVAVSACGVGLGMSSIAIAQQAQTRQNDAQSSKPAQAGQAAQWQNSDQKLANCIAIANQTEVVIAKQAAQKVKSSEVKEFAQMLVKDHQDFLQKLQKYAPEASKEGYLNDHSDAHSNDSDRKSTSKQPQPRVQQAAGEAQAANGQIQQTSGAKVVDANQPLDMVQLHREIAEECIRSAKLGMDKKEGKELDECFVGFQIAAHASMKDKLTVFKRHASPELAQVIGEGIDATEKHMKKAESLMKELAGSDRDSQKRDRSEK